MGGFSEFDGSTGSFAGLARLFPLPGSAIFPHVVQALHIFEPRYQALLHDALDGDGLIAIGSLKPGWEADYDDHPDVEPIVCVGQIVGHQPLDNGRHNILIAGQQRAYIREEIESDELFRLVQIELLDDIYPQNDVDDRGQLRRQLIDGFFSMTSDTIDFQDDSDQLLNEQLSLGTLTDVIAHSLKLPTAIQQQLLAQLNVDERALLLLDHLEEAVAASIESSPTTFPPPPSTN